MSERAVADELARLVLRLQSETDDAERAKLRGMIADLKDATTGAFRS